MVKRQIDMDSVKDQVVAESQGESVRKPRTHFAIKILVVLLIIAFAAAGWFYWKYAKTQQILTGAQTEAEIEQEIKEVTAAVGKLMFLPNEKPEIATVIDPDALVKDQPFYEGVKKGDKVLFYPEAKRAIVYSPSRNLIINAGPVYYADEATVSQAEVAPAVSGEADSQN